MDRLTDIKEISHAIYADDLTVCATANSARTKQDALQRAVHGAEAYLKDCGEVRAANSEETHKREATTGETGSGADLERSHHTEGQCDPNPGL